MQLVLSSSSTDSASIPSSWTQFGNSAFRNLSSFPLNSRPRTSCLPVSRRATPPTTFLSHVGVKEHRLLLLSELPPRCFLPPRYENQTSRCLKTGICLIGWELLVCFFYFSSRCRYHIDPPWKSCSHGWKLCFLLRFGISHNN